LGLQYPLADRDAIVEMAGENGNEFKNDAGCRGIWERLWKKGETEKVDAYGQRIDGLIDTFLEKTKAAEFVSLFEYGDDNVRDWFSQPPQQSGTSSTPSWAQ
jgi:hypothetical protein